MTSLEGVFEFSSGRGAQVKLHGFFQNRRDLISRLNLDTDALDETILAEAYRKWGERCPEYFEGEFAFAIEEREKFFAARDPLGVKPFHYTRLGKQLYYASYVTDLFRPGVSRKPNARMILATMLEEHSDQEISLYEGIYRLPAGHRLVLDTRGLSVSKYFELEPEPFFCGVRDFAGELKEILSQAIADRLERDRSVGVLLSGGLDSSSLVRLAGERDHRRIQSLSLSFDDETASDQGMLARVNESAPWKAHVLRARAGAVYLGEVGENADVVFHPSLHMFEPLFELARKEGIGEVWMGYGPDELLTPGPAAMADLLRRGRVGRVLSEMKEAELLASGDFWSYAVKPCFPTPLVRVARKFIPPRPPSWTCRRSLARSLLEAAAERLRKAAFKFPDWTRRSRYQRLFLSGDYPIGFERQAHYAHLQGLNLGYPMLNLRMIRFAFRLPLEEMLWSRGGKRLLREAVRGTVPDEVRLKAKFQDYTRFALDVLEGCRGRFEPWLRDSLLVKEGFLHSSMVERLASPREMPQQINFVLNVIQLERWLRTF